MTDVSILEMIGWLGIAAFELVLYAFGALHLVVFVACLFGGVDKDPPHTEHSPKKTP